MTNAYFDIQAARDEWQAVRRKLADATDLLHEQAKALRQAREALEHIAPDDCWSTGPLTGDAIKDHVICPGCVAIATIDAILKGRGE